MFPRKSSRIGLLSVFLLSLFSYGCAFQSALKKDDKHYFYDYNRLVSELSAIQEHYPHLVQIQTVGKTYEGRAIYVIRVTGSNPEKSNRPALLTIFGEHGAEHEGTVLAMGLTRFLVENYGKEQSISDLLNEKTIYILPMMNADGVEYDLSGQVKPYTWRKNRKPTGEESYGVDLNRNWGHFGDAPLPEELAKELGNKDGSHYAGEEPFSERETRAVRDFLLTHPDIKMFVDYHTGGGGFVQGMIIIPPSVSEDAGLESGQKARYHAIAEQFAQEISDPNRKDPPFVVQSGRNVAESIKPYLPWYLKPFFPKNIPYPSGTSGDWVYGELGIIALGVESTRSQDFFARLPLRIEQLVDSQLRGYLYLLDLLSDNPLQRLGSE